MINPIIVEFTFLGREWAIHWYGVIIAISVMIGVFLAERQITKRGGSETFVWDLILWVVPAGIIVIDNYGTTMYNPPEVKPYC